MKSKIREFSLLDHSIREQQLILNDYEFGGNDVFPSYPIDRPDDANQLDNINNLFSGDYNLIINYPLERKWKFVLSNEDDMTVKGLYEDICHVYRKIYEEEERTATNRRQSREIWRTNGDFQIWGHSIGDLYLEGLRVVRDEYDEIYVVPSIGS